MGKYLRLTDEPRMPIPQQEPYDPRKKKAQAEAKAAEKPPEPPAAATLAAS